MAAGVMLYGATVAPGLLWGDSGEIQLHVLLDGWYVNGEIVRSHVLHTAIARFLHWLLPLPATLTVNLVSALAGAVTVANVAWLLRTICRSRTAVLCGTALLMVSHTLWMLSTSAEVVTLSTALLSAELVFFTKLAETRSLRWLATLMLANGLGVSNHNFALLMWPVYVILAVRWWPNWPRPRWLVAATGGGALLAGMAPVLALCVDDLMARGSVGVTLVSFLVGQYIHQVVNYGNLPGLLLRAVAITILNFPTPLVLLAIPGLFHLRRVAGRSVCGLLVGAALVYTAFAVRYDVPDQHTFLVPAFIFIAIFAAVGLDRLLYLRRGVAAPALACGLSVLGPILYAALPPLLQKYAPDLAALPTRRVVYRERFSWFLRPWRCGYDGPERFARETLEALPPDAWLAVDSTLSPPLNYLQVAESLRQDVRLDSWNARQDWFEAGEPERLREAKLAADLLFVASDDPSDAPKWLKEPVYRLEPFGHGFRVRRGP